MSRDRISSEEMETIQNALTGIIRRDADDSLHLTDIDDFETEHFTINLWWVFPVTDIGYYPVLDVQDKFGKTVLNTEGFELMNETDLSMFAYQMKRRLENSLARRGYAVEL